MATSFYPNLLIYSIFLGVKGAIPDICILATPIYKIWLFSFKRIFGEHVTLPIVKFQSIGHDFNENIENVQKVHISFSKSIKNKLQMG